MTCDDIFCAATEGDIEQLRALLNEGGKEILKEKIQTDPDEEDGTVCSFTVVFSVLCSMQDNVNYEVLDMLFDAGGNINEAVVVKTGNLTKRRPLLEYAINVWQDETLVEYMLKKGANPNAFHTETNGAGKTSRTVLLWYALDSENDSKMLELLLRYGADPEKCCEIYAADIGTYQYLPPLYYSLVEYGNLSQTVCLIRYGASPQCGIDVGTGLMHNTNFKRYISIYHPHLSNALIQAFDVAQRSPAKQVVHIYQPPEQIIPSAQFTLQSLQEGPSGHKLNAGSKVKSMRRCYTKATAYFFANFAIIGLAFGVFAPLFVAGDDRELAGGFMIFGVPCLLIAALIWMGVKKKAEKRGQDGVMLRFVGDSVLVFGAVLLMFTIVFVALGKSIVDSVPWEERKTTSGGSVWVKKTGNGTYEDAQGNKYEE